MLIIGIVIGIVITCVLGYIDDKMGCGCFHWWKR